MDDHTRFNELLSQGLEASGQGRSEAALGFFAQASALVPASGVPHFLAGAEHASAGDVDAAELSFANAVLLAPDFHLARYQLGLLQFSSGRASIGLLTWQALFSQPEEDPLAHFVRGFAALAEDRFEEALQHYRRGLERNGGNPALSADIGKVIEAVEGLLRRQAGESGASAAPQHVLLSGYAKDLH